MTVSSDSDLSTKDAASQGGRPLPFLPSMHRAAVLKAAQYAILVSTKDGVVNCEAAVITLVDALCAPTKPETAIKKVSLLVNGKIPAETKCPFAVRCEIHSRGSCHQKEEEFSCGSARGFDLIYRLGV